MPVKEIIDNLKSFLDKNKEHFVKELSVIKTGRANPGLIDGILVDYYGVKTPLKQIASISVPEPKQIAIQPWDKNAIEPICSAILKSNLNLSPIVDKEIIRINIPPLTEERRKDLVKSVGLKLEEMRIAVRRMRDDAIKNIRNLEDKKQISEDEKMRTKENIDKIIENHNKSLAEMAKEKEREILTG